MTAQLARDILIVNLSLVTDNALRTAMEIAIETIDDNLIRSWNMNYKDRGVELRDYLGYSEKGYLKYIINRDYSEAGVLYDNRTD